MFEFHCHQSHRLIRTDSVLDHNVWAVEQRHKGINLTHDLDEALNAHGKGDEKPARGGEELLPSSRAPRREGDKVQLPSPSEASDPEPGPM